VNTLQTVATLGVLSGTVLGAALLYVGMQVRSSVAVARARRAVPAGRKGAAS